jgi:hypothetical protein
MYDKKKIAVEVINTGNINDIGKISMYVNGIKQDDTHHCELDPEQSKTILFDLNNKIDIKPKIPDFCNHILIKLL